MAVRSSRISTARYRCRRCGAFSRCRSATTARTLPGGDRVSWSTAPRPCCALLDPERAHQLWRCGRRRAALIRAPPMRRAAAYGERARPFVSHADRPCRRVRQERRGARRDARHGLRLRRGRHGHAAAAGGQSASAPVPPLRRPRHHQPAGLQQRGARSASRAPRSASGAPTASSASTSAPTATARTAPTITSRACGSSRRSPPISRSTSPRRTRRACASCRNRSHLVELLVRAGEARAQAAKESGRRTPLFVKVAPDLSEASSTI